MRFTFSFSILFLLVTLLPAQNRLSWKDGPFSQEKIPVIPETRKDLAFELKYYFGWSTVSQKWGKDSTGYREVVEGGIELKDSWQLPDQPSAYIEVYGQALLNIIELNRRKLQYELNHLQKDVDPRKISQHYYDLLNQELQGLESDTHERMDSLYLADFLQNTEDQLAAFPDPVGYEVSSMPWGIGFFLYMGYGVYPASGQVYFSNPVNYLGYGLRGNYKNLEVQFSGSFGTSRLIKAFTDAEGNFWPAQNRLSTTYVNAVVGWRLQAGSKFELSPQAGIGVHESLLIVRPRVPDAPHIDNYGPLIGGVVRYRLFTHIAPGEVEDLFLTGFCYYGPGPKSPAYQGGSFQFGIAIDVHASPLRRAFYDWR